jgi:hypothetical protein
VLRFASRVVVLLVLLASSARADEAAARQRFKRGIDLYDRARYADALAEFEAAYREKASATIKQNIALSLRRLNRPAEAATAFDEAIAEGRELKPETRAAIERELAELEKTIATVRITSVDTARTPVDAAIDVVPAPPRASKTRTFRLVPGLYTFTAHAAGFPDPPEKKLALVAGPSVDVTFVFGESLGRATPGDASGATLEAPTPRVGPAEAPPPYVAPAAPPPKRSRFVVAGGIALDTTSYRLGVPAGEPAPYGTRYDGFVGLSLGARFGVFLAKTIVLDLHAEIGQSAKKYDSRETTVLHVEAVPMLRFVAPGSVRFTAATGFGGHVLSVKSPNARGSGLNGSWRLEGGLQIDVRPVFFEGALFLDVHGVGSVKADTPAEDRLLYASPAARGGIRLGLGATFE